MAKVAFIGLGVMGYPMAGHLRVRGGHELTVYNRTVAKAEKWAAEFGGTCSRDAGAKRPMAPISSSPASATTTTCARSPQARTAPSKRMKQATPSSSTTPRPRPKSPVSFTRRPKARGAHFVDAPVSGGQAGAENGALTVMCGGDEPAFERAKPVIDAFARMVGLMGPAGAGQITKMINQICIAGLVQGLAEGIHFGKKAGLDIEKVIDVISKGAAGSWQMENRHKTMNAGKYDFGFAVDWMRKDLDIVLDGSAPQRRQAAGDRPRRPVLWRRAGHGRKPLGYVFAARSAGKMSALADLERRRHHRAPADAALAGEPRRHGTVRHRHRDGAWALECRAPPDRATGEDRPCPRARTLAVRHPRGTHSRRLHRRPEDVDARRGKALGR